MVHVSLRHGHVFCAESVHFIRDTNRNLFQARQHIQLCEEEIRNPVDPCRIARDHRIKPTRATSSTRGHTNFATSPAKIFSSFVMKFSREWTGANSSGVSLQDTQDRGDAAGTNTRTSTGTASCG